MNLMYTTLTICQVNWPVPLIGKASSGHEAKLFHYLISLQFKDNKETYLFSNIDHTTFNCLISHSHDFLPKRSTSDILRYCTFKGALFDSTY